MHFALINCFYFHSDDYHQTWLSLWSSVKGEITVKMNKCSSEGSAEWMIMMIVSLLFYDKCKRSYSIQAKVTPTYWMCPKDNIETKPFLGLSFDQCAPV